MKSYILAMALVAATGLLLESGCSGPRGHGTTPPSSPAQGALAIFGGETPFCGVLSFTVTITGLTLTPQSGSSPLSVLSSGTQVTVEFASLMDFATPFSLSNVPPGTYSSLGITLANPQLTYMDTSTSPPSIKTVAPAISTLTVSLPLNPAITIASGGSLALQLDFNLLNSITTGAGGLFTATPTFTATPALASGSTGYAQFDDLSGLVQNVSTSSANPSFTGSFTISSPNAQTFTVEVASSTSFAGASGLSGLTPGTFVEISAVLDANANLVAGNVVAEAQEDAASGEAAFAGLITAVAPPTGNATQFTMLVQTENPDVSSRVPVFSLLTVSISSSSTTFATSAQGADFANFSYGANSLAVGQRVVVHGTLPSGSAAATSATARSVFLGLQSILGNLSTNPSTPVAIAGDGVDGGFTLVPCSPLFQNAPITALVNQQTVYSGLANLSSLNNPGSHFLLVKGLLFYEQSTTTFGVESWTAPAGVQAATEVHQLP
ncbi:MAG: DUF5666 domain-containing protein [Terriglobia bacterium]